jgi:hypothetical protein
MRTPIAPIVASLLLSPATLGCGSQSPAVPARTAPSDAGADPEASRRESAADAAGGVSDAASSGIPASFFGFVVNKAGDTTPALPFGTWRIWDDQAQWPNLQPVGGAFQWQPLDVRLDAIRAASVTDVLYTFMRVPDWAATQTDQYFDGAPITCNYSQYPSGGVRNCYPPNDVAEDGGGPDLIFRTAVAAIGGHIAQKLPTGTHLYWTLWDEIYRSTTLISPSALPESIGKGQMSWEGTYPQLVRVFQDASCILNGNVKEVLATGETCAAVQKSVGLDGPVAPTSMVLSPGGSASYEPFSFSVIQQFLYCNVGADAGLAPCAAGQGGASAVDGINFEQYVYGTDSVEASLDTTSRASPDCSSRPSAQSLSLAPRAAGASRSMRPTAASRTRPIGTPT